MRFSLLFAFLAFLLNAPASLAHNENELSYIFENGELTIYLTPKTITDLLLHLGAVPEGQANVKIENFHADLSRYFNGNIELRMASRDIRFELLNADHSGHDATLTFQMKNVPAKSDGFELTVNCFVDVYNRAANYVRWVSPEGTWERTLNKGSRTWAVAYPSGSKHVKGNLLWLLAVGVGLLLLAFAVWGSKHKPV